MTFKVIETFSGIGSQAKALNNLHKQIPGFNYEIVATVEWEIGAIYAYDIIHNGKQNLDKYDHLNKTDLVNILSEYNFSRNGKKPFKQGSLHRMNLTKLKSIYHSIQNNNNLIDISKVQAINLPDADLLTYSFPCQDLSISSYWHQNFSGIDRHANNSSSLLWEIERILFEYTKIDKKLPRFLLMENVTAIQGPRHKDNFNTWKKQLNVLGYTNFCYVLNSSDFGIPQDRKRTFMISIYTNDLNETTIKKLGTFFDENTAFKNNKKVNIDSFLRLNYKQQNYYNEAKSSTPNYTPSRVKIHEDSILLNGDESLIARTITTKQDRNPNAGLIIHNENFGKDKAPYRYLTPRETFLLMGFEENDFQILMDNNFLVTKSRKILTQSKLLQLAGNSIVVNVLEAIFHKIIHAKLSIIDNKSTSRDIGEKETIL